MKPEKLKRVLRLHQLWLDNDPGGLWANLSGANLSGADLTWANLCGADLTRADLREANLSGADLTWANLCEANLCEADLSGADLTWANLCEADLTRADLREAKLPHFQICPEDGDFIAWKKITTGVVKLLITGERTSTLVGRKCRCSECTVIGGDVGGVDQKTREIKYSLGAVIKPDSYDPDIRVECTHGIHFFMTKKEAEEY